MHIEGMSDQEKSVLLAFAWRMLNWWDGLGSEINWVAWVEFSGFWEDAFFIGFPPIDARCLWYDQILELAIEAGIVEPPESP